MSSKLQLQKRLVELRIRQEEGVATSEDLEEIRMLKDQIENIGKRLILPESTGGSSRERSNNGPFDNLGGFLQAVHRAGVPGGDVDGRLGEIRAASGLSEGTPSSGGYLVQTDFTNQLIESAFQTGKLARLCNTFELSSNSNRLEINGVDESSRATGSRWGGIRGYWASEAAEKTKSAPKFRKIKLKLNKLIGLCYATDELLDDVTALEGVIRRGFASEFGFQIDDAIVNGSGAGMPLGIMNAGNMVTVDAVGSQGANTIIYENVVALWSRLLPGSEATAVWLYNKDCMPQLATMSSDGSGNSPVFQNGTGVVSAGTAGPIPGTIFGRPAMSCEQCQSLGTAGDIILADFSQYILARKGGIQADMSIHVRSNKWASHGSDAMMNSSLIRGNLNRKARQSRASRDSNVRQRTESRASVETLQELPLAA
jgi:HK97 family phage major capsid protein